MLKDNKNSKLNGGDKGIRTPDRPLRRQQLGLIIWLISLLSFQLHRVLPVFPYENRDTAKYFEIHSDITKLFSPVSHFVSHRS